jgi:hypothetical protein
MDTPLLRTPIGDESLAISAEAARLGIEVCYCSIYDDCWWLVRRSFGGGTRWEHAEVRECVVEDSRRFKM